MRQGPAHGAADPGCRRLEQGGRQIRTSALVEQDDFWWATGQVASLQCALGPGPIKERYHVRLEVGTRIPYMAPMPDRGRTSHGTSARLSSEYISWAPAGALDSLDQVARTHRMQRTMWQGAAAGEPGTG